MPGLVSEHNIQQERKTLTLGTYFAGKLMAVFAQVVGYLNLIPKEISGLNLLYYIQATVQEDIPESHHVFCTQLNT